MGKHRGPTPSLLPARTQCCEQIEYDEVRRIMLASCWSKNAYPSLYQARQIAAAAQAKTHEPIQPYQCPFHTLRADRHWHIGHVPSHEDVARMALAIRWCAQHPDQLPVPGPT